MEINIGGYKLVIDKGEVRASSEIMTSMINFTNLSLGDIGKESSATIK